MERDVGREQYGPGRVPRSAPTTAHPSAAARPHGRADPTTFVPLTGAPPGQGLTGAPAAPRRRRALWWVLAAVVLVVALLAVGGFVVLTGGQDGPGPVVAAPAPPPAAPAPADPAPVDPSSVDPSSVDPSSAQGRLDTQVSTDAAAVTALADRWVPQLYAERLGAVRGTSTMDATSILRDYTAVKSQYPNALLLVSGDFTSFAMPGYYVVVEPRGFATAQEALAWCTSEARGSEFCYAKLLSHTAAPEGSTVYRR